ncbi:hypothetical protein FACS1894152_3570 [Bacilli bacterium]|nr:hypothetical protein FACS1894152_3570 [Bacilli bacterium]
MKVGCLRRFIVFVLVFGLEVGSCGIKESKADLLGLVSGVTATIMWVTGIGLGCRGFCEHKKFNEYAVAVGGIFAAALGVTLVSISSQGR